jgi:hypothetical protein
MHKSIIQNIGTGLDLWWENKMHEMNFRMRNDKEARIKIKFFKCSRFQFGIKNSGRQKQKL